MFSPKKWAQFAGLAVLWHLLWTSIATTLVPNDIGRSWVFPVYLFLVLPAIFIVMYHLISVMVDVAMGKYGKDRVLKLMGIFALGPFMTGYLAWNHEKFGQNDSKKDRN